MQLIEWSYSSLEQQIKEEEFRYWDASRNGCSELVLEGIKERIERLKAEVVFRPRTKIILDKEYNIRRY